MFTIVGMCVVMHTAETVIKKVSGNDEDNGRNQQPCRVVSEE